MMNILKIFTKIGLYQIKTKIHVKKTYNLLKNHHLISCSRNNTSSEIKNDI